MIGEWASRSPRWFTCLWFAFFRLTWAIYWFGVTASKVAKPEYVSSLLPIVFSTMMAGLLGYFLGYTLVLADRTKSYWKAILKGIVVEHLTTILYLPFAALAISFYGKPFAATLYLSYVFSLAGIPIHTILGAITGALLFYVSKRNSVHA